MSNSSNMPALDLDSIEMDEDERGLVSQIIKANGRLYASKPKNATGDARYLWRMVAFGISPVPAHQHLPVMAEFDLPGDFDERRERAKELDDLAKRVESSIPVEQRHSTLMWGRMLGML